MKRALTLLLAVLFVVALFSGCNGNSGNTPATQAPATQAPATQAPATQAPATQAPATQAPATEAPEATPEPTPEPEPASPYNFAAGKFAADANGLATEKYDYTLPLSTTDEVLTYWGVCYTPQSLPAEGFNSMPFPQGVEEMTGVHVEYSLLASDARQNNFSVLIASDSLMDIMCGASSYYNGVFKESVTEEGYFANLYDYREYMPNYIYEVMKDPSDKDTINRVFPEKDLILAFYELRQELELSAGAFARGDWLWDMGKTNADIKTFDDLHDMLYFFKSQKNCETPFTLISTLDSGNEFIGYDTLFYTNGINALYVKDGEVCLADTGDRDREIMTLMNQWYNEGLIDPNWASYSLATDYDSKIDTGEMGYMINVRPSTMNGHAAAIPEGAKYGWVAMTKPVKEVGQTLHLGYYVSRIYFGSASIAASCENIPLAVTWLDYRYSDSGSFLYGYGIQGVSWDYDENGEIYITDLILNNEVFYSMYMLLYALNSIGEPGLYINYTWKVPGNEIGYTYLQDWERVNHDNAYVWPSGIQYTSEQAEIRASYGDDLQTYIDENYVAFLDGSKPLSEFDDYVANLHAIGLDEVLAACQEAYDAYMAG